MIDVMSRGSIDGSVLRQSVAPKRVVTEISDIVVTEIGGAIARKVQRLSMQGESVEHTVSCLLVLDPLVTAITTSVGDHA